MAYLNFKKKEMENWKKINGYENYSISDMGRVRNNETNYIRKIRNSKLGYEIIKLQGKMFQIHRLVGIHFISNPENKKEINHKNGIKTDNRIENLEWCNRSENMKHLYTDLSYNSHLTKKIIQYKKNGELIKIWNSISDIQRELGIEVSSISACCLNRINRKTAGGFKWKYYE